MNADVNWPKGHDAVTFSFFRNLNEHREEARGDMCVSLPVSQKHLAQPVAHDGDLISTCWVKVGRTLGPESHSHSGRMQVSKGNLPSQSRATGHEKYSC